MTRTVFPLLFELANKKFYSHPATIDEGTEGYRQEDAWRR